jgi:hypothetical protein
VETSGNDVFWAVRERAIQAVGTIRSAPITATLEAQAQHDAHSHVRAAALTALGAYDDRKFATFFSDRYAAEGSPLAKAAAKTAMDNLAIP